MWYKRIYKYLRLFLVWYPLFYWLLIFCISCDWEWDSCETFDHIPAIAKFFLITYLFGIILIFCLFWFYTLFLVKNKILYNVKQLIRKYCKIFKIRKKKIWKYPIIIQYAPPKWLTPMEVSYLYNLKYFKWSISCLFYKWAAEKRISMDFIKWNILSFDKIEIKIIDNSLENMPKNEQCQWSLIFGQNKEISLPNIDIFKKIPTINIQTAKSCLDKKLIDKKFSINLTAKNVSSFLATLWIISIFFLVFFSFAAYFGWGIPKRIAVIALISIPFSVIMIFWCFLTKTFYEKNSLTYYKLSEKWKAILAEIYWYKYFLETCDEKKIKTFLEQDPEYLDKTMPYAVALWVETEILESVSPKILDWMNNNRYFWDLSSAKTLIVSSERNILVHTEKEWKKKVRKSPK